MAKNKYARIKGDKDFLVAMVVCVFLCLWSIRDAWFPTQKVLEKHPQSMPISMKVSGVVKSLPLAPGSEVGGAAVLAVLYDDSYQKVADEAEFIFQNAKKNKDADVQERLDELMEARANVDACVLKATEITQQTSHGEDTLRGIVLEHAVQISDEVSAGQPILYVQPHDTFYLFNKTLALISFIGAVVFLMVHRKVTK